MKELKNKKLYEIKDKVRNFVEGVDSFYKYAPYTITEVSGEWKMPSPEAVNTYRDFALYVGECIDFLSESEEEKEVISAIILINGIVANDVTGSWFSLPSNADIMKFMSEHKGERKMLRITESLNVPKGGEWCEAKVKEDKIKIIHEDNKNMKVTENYNAYVYESPYYLREVEWNFPIFKAD